MCFARISRVYGREGLIGMGTGDGASEKGLSRSTILTAQVVSAYAANNTVPTDRLASLIIEVHATLVALTTPVVTPDRAEPFVPIKKSVFPNYIICLEDGRQLKMLKRYLKTHHSMTPEQYRDKWGLPKDYPMTAPLYAERRSVLARTTGLGRRGAEDDAETTAADAAGPGETPIPAKPRRQVNTGTA